MRIRRDQIPFLKNLIMFGVGLPVAVLGALSGIGVQVAAQPMIRFLLGLTPERSQGTAIAFGLVVSASGLIGAAVGGLGSNLTTSLILAISATVGALLVVRLAVDPKLTKARRIAQTASMLLGVYLVSIAVRPRYGQIGLESEFFRSSTVGFALIGLVTGLFSSIFHLASGVLLIGSLILLSGLAAPQSIVISLIVATLASIIPGVAHASAGHVDTGAGLAMIIGGALGGFSGGFILAKLAGIGSPIPLVVFSLTAMFLSAYTAWKMS